MKIEMRFLCDILYIQILRYKLFLTASKFRRYRRLPVLPVCNAGIDHPEVINILYFMLYLCCSQFLIFVKYPKVIDYASTLYVSSNSRFFSSYIRNWGIEFGDLFRNRISRVHTKNCCAYTIFHILGN